MDEKRGEKVNHSNDYLLEQTGSYIDFCIVDLNEVPFHLKVPTFWNPKRAEWIAVIQTIKTHQIIMAAAPESQELSTKLTEILMDILKNEDELSNELLSMFSEIK